MPTIKEKLSEVMNSIMIVVSGAIELFKWFVENKEPVMATFEGVSKLLKIMINPVGAVIDIFKKLIGVTIDIMKNFDQLKTNVQQKWEEIKATITTKVTEIVTNVTTWFENMKINVINKIQELKASFAAKVEEIKTNVSTGFNYIVTTVTTFMSNMVTTATTKAGEVASGIINKVKEIPSKMIQVGKDIVNGIKNGISQAWSNMAGWIGQKCNSFIDNVKSKFDINSPSRVMRDQVGKFIAEGIGVGFTEEMPVVNADISKTLDNTINVSKDTVKTKESTVGSVNYNNRIDGVIAAIESLKSVLSSITINLDGKKVGNAVTPYVSGNLAFNNGRKRW